MNAFNALIATYYHEIKFGLFFSAMNVIWMFGEKLAGLHDVTELGGEMNFKQGFMSGLGITIIVTALTPIIQFIIHTVITPDYFTNVRAFVIKQGMNPEVANTHFTLNSFIMLSVFTGFMYGIITTIFTTIMVRYVRMKR
ncbi:MAG: DUF4199 domain-containing protein [Bacteroidetes bacterium]|nr:DUF4199 domain-containing protein [Bacteroidota bacterium]